MTLLFDGTQNASNSFNDGLLDLISLIVQVSTLIFTVFWYVHLRNKERDYRFLNELTRNGLVELFSSKMPSEIKKFDAPQDGLLKAKEKDAFKDFVTFALQKILCLKYAYSKKYARIRKLLLDMDAFVQVANRNTKEFTAKLHSMADDLCDELKSFY